MLQKIAAIVSFAAAILLLMGAQMLASQGNNLFYYTFPKDSKQNYEVDFLLSRSNKIIPIEVKSSGYKTHKSLDAFCEKHPSRISNQ